MGCDMAHQAPSRSTGLAWIHPDSLGPDLAKSLEPPQSIWSGFGQKIAIFGALDAWIGAWIWQKWPQALLSHQLGCDMAHQAFSRWTGLAWSPPDPFGPDLAKK